MRKDLRIGAYAETFVGDLLLDAGATVSKIDGKFSDYDIEFHHKLLSGTIEIKYDMMSAKTGNLAIEIFNPKSQIKSGLHGTKADYWAIMLPGDLVFFCKTGVLIEYTEVTPPKRIVRGGDNNSQMLLYEKEKILQIFYQHEPGISIIKELKCLK